MRHQQLTPDAQEDLGAGRTTGNAGGYLCSVAGNAELVGPKSSEDKGVQT